MAKIQYKSLGDEATEMPRMDELLRNLHNNLRSGEWKEPAGLTDLGTDVVYQFGHYQLLGTICFVRLQFTSDDLSWDWATGPELDLPVDTTRPAVGGQQGGYIHPGAITLFNDSGTYPLTGINTAAVFGAPSRVQLVAAYSVAPITIATPMLHKISGYFWVHV